MSIGRAWIGLLGRAYFFFNQKEKEEIKRNVCAVIQRVPNREPMNKIIQRTFQGIFAHYHEKLLAAHADYDKMCEFVRRNVKFEGKHLVDEALSQGRGLVLVTAHFGAVEFLPAVLALQGYRVTMVVRFKTERLKQILIPRVAPLGITLLDASNGEGVVFSACQALKSNQVLITEGDEFEAWRPYRDRLTPFLGYSSPLDRTLDLVQRRYDSPVIMGFVLRENGFKYRLELQDLNGVPHVSEVASLSQRALHTLEQYICSAPDQWYQWKDVRIILGPKIFQEARPILETKADRSLSFANSARRV